MADGDYERRAAHDAEMKRLERMIRESREHAAEKKERENSDRATMLASDVRF